MGRPRRVTPAGVEHLASIPVESLIRFTLNLPQDAVDRIIANGSVSVDRKKAQPGQMFNVKPGMMIRYDNSQVTVVATHIRLMGLFLNEKKDLEQGGMHPTRSG